MAKKSPKQPQPEPVPTKEKATPISVKQPPLPPEVAKRAIKFYRDSREIELGIWRSING